MLQDRAAGSPEIYRDKREGLSELEEIFREDLRSKSVWTKDQLQNLGEDED